ncbi:MazG family protein [Cryobacterium psychrophilum]|uniref:MazG family protein n=1 Tax=Cryobacterium psychrophilum TaxID=41988 RepID=A0A4Y8KIZ4_9MICO|nr:MazG family protein [Cryobacterium psychrophilum]TDW30796.1 XTP/dITP diphosphohydrolase [Cryobacterium psychrophilum]TFD75807.1 MazG family protein [Cryobacterium psychrophilum]
MTDAAPTTPGTGDEATANSLGTLIATVARLRGPGGCAWDAEQTHESLVQYLVEESHELLEAIESGSRNDLLEELGDVLYQVLFHADLAAHTKGENFDIQDVAHHMNAKMIGRHPHVFGDLRLDTAADVTAAWDGFKSEEKPERTSVLDGIPVGMPSLALAHKVLGRAEKIGLLEADDAFPLPIESEDQLGPLLLAIVSAARSKGLDAERALRGALRDLQGEIREAETAMAPNTERAVDVDSFDAGIIGLPTAPQP